MISPYRWWRRWRRRFTAADLGAAYAARSVPVPSIGWPVDALAFPDELAGLDEAMVWLEDVVVLCGRDRPLRATCMLLLEAGVRPAVAALVLQAAADAAADDGDLEQRLQLVADVVAAGVAVDGPLLFSLVAAGFRVETALQLSGMPDVAVIARVRDGGSSFPTDAGFLLYWLARESQLRFLGGVAPWKLVLA